MPIKERSCQTGTNPPVSLSHVPDGTDAGSTAGHSLIGRHRELAFSISNGWRRTNYFFLRL